MLSELRPGTEIRFIRTRVRTTLKDDPALQLKLEKLLAQQIAVGKKIQIHHVQMNAE